MKMYEKIYQENVSILSERFPTFFLHTISFSMTHVIFQNKQGVFNARGKEGLFYPDTYTIKEIETYLSKKKNDQYKLIYVYGVGLGYEYFYLKTWLQKNANRKLIFLEDDRENFTLFLHLPHAKELIANKQVYIYFSEKDFQENYINQIAYQHPEAKTQMICSWHYRQTKKNKFNHLKCKIFEKTTFFEGQETLIDGLNILCAQSIDQIKRMHFSSYINEMENSCKNIPAVVCGAGPSLQESANDIKKMSSQALVIAGGSAITSLSSYGIPFHIGVLIDPNFEEYKRMKSSQAFEAFICYTNTLNYDVTYTINGRWGYIKTFNDIELNHWLAKQLRLKRKMMGKDIDHNAYTVSFAALSLAKFLGCNPIMVSGVDLAYTNNYRYAEGVLSQQKSVLAQSIDHVSNQLVEAKNKKNKVIKSNIMWSLEKKALYNFIKKSSSYQFFTSTQEALAVDNLPYMSIKDYRKKYCQKQRDLINHLFCLFENHCFSPKIEKKIILTMKKLYRDTLEVLKMIRMIIDETKRLDKDQFYETGKMVLAQTQMKDFISPYLFVEKPMYQASQFMNEKKYDEWLEQWQQMERTYLLLTDKLGYFIE